MQNNAAKTRTVVEILVMLVVDSHDISEEKGADYEVLEVYEGKETGCTKDIVKTMPASFCAGQCVYVRVPMKHPPVYDRVLASKTTEREGRRRA